MPPRARDPLAPTAQDAQVASALEGDYIANLQQQVYYLEQQGRVLRDTISKPGPEVKTRSVVADPILNPALDDAAPLNDHIAALKEKYVYLLRSTDKKLRDADEAHAALKEEVRGYQNEIKRLREDLEAKDELASQVATETEMKTRQLLVEAEQAHTKASKRKRKISELRIALENGGEARAASAAEVERLRAELAEARAESARLTRSLRAPSEVDAIHKKLAEAEISIADAKQELANEQTRSESLAAELTASKDAQWELERAKEKLEAQVRSLTRAREQLEAESTRARQAAMDARGQLETAETELRTLRRENERLREVGGGDAAERDVRVLLQMAKDDNKRLETELTLSKEATQTSRDETASARALVEDLSAEKELLLAKVEKLGEANVELEAQRVEDAATVRTQQAELELRAKAIAEVEDARDTALRRADELDAAQAVLREKVAIKRDLDELAPRLAELGDLRQTSNELAGVLNRLSSRLRSVEGDDVSVFSERTCSTHAVKPMELNYSPTLEERVREDFGSPEAPPSRPTSATVKNGFADTQKPELVASGVSPPGSVHYGREEHTTDAHSEFSVHHAQDVEKEKGLQSLRDRPRRGWNPRGPDAADDSEALQFIVD